jgi:hypothetical protein
MQSLSNTAQQLAPPTGGLVKIADAALLGNNATVAAVTFDGRLKRRYTVEQCFNPVRCSDWPSVDITECM